MKMWNKDESSEKIEQATMGPMNVLPWAFTKPRQDP